MGEVSRRGEVGEVSRRGEVGLPKKIRKKKIDEGMSLVTKKGLFLLYFISCRLMGEG